MILRTCTAMYPPLRYVSGDHANEKRRKPEVILTVDHQGQMTPMATGVMLVKDIAGNTCSRVLQVLYNSGG